MSGFEVVGVVLGAIPLVIEIVRECQSTTNYRREWKTLKRRLETEYLILQDTCEKPLISIVPFHKIASFLKDPFGSLWKTKEAQASLRRRLWNSYRLFEETVQEMKQAITQLGELFGLDVMTRVCQTICLCERTINRPIGKRDCRPERDHKPSGGNVRVVPEEGSN